MTCRREDPWISIYKDAAITLCSTSQRFCQKNELKRQHTDGQTNLNLKTPFRKTDSRYPATPWVGDISLFVSSLAEPTLRSLDKHRTQTLAVEKIKKESLFPCPWSDSSCSFQGGRGRELKPNTAEQLV